MELHGVHHVSINVGDHAEAHRFYTDVLGLTELPRPDLGFPGSWLAAGDQEIHLLEVEGVEAPKGQHFALRVHDLDVAIAHLADHGVSTTQPSEIAGVCRQAFFQDPTGNLIELNQPIG